MEFVNGDITNVTFGFICHQANCQGVMGAGVALAIRNKWPVVYTEYRRAYTNGELKLGNVVFVHIKHNLLVANLCGQDKYGRTGTFTDYKAVTKALTYLDKVRQEVNEKTGLIIPVYFPNRMGCGLAGGNWDIMIKIIKKCIPDAKIISYNL